MREVSLPFLLHHFVSSYIYTLRINRRHPPWKFALDCEIIVATLPLSHIPIFQVVSVVSVVIELTATVPLTTARSCPEASTVSLVIALNTFFNQNESHIFF